MEITEDGPNLAMIDNEGNPSASATMLWEEITEVELKWLIPKKGKENLIEHIPTPEEVLALFKELAGGEDFETKRKLEDEEGLFLWDIALPDKDGSGGSIEYLYIRKGDHSKRGLTGGMLPETMINKVFVNADGLPIHGYSVAKLSGDNWKITP